MVMRNLPTYIIGVIVSLLLTLFILYPLAAVLVESFVVVRPMHLDELKEMTEEALAYLPEDRRERQIRAWGASATPTQALEATAATLELIGHPPSWDRTDRYERQRAAAEQAVASLDPADRKRFDAEYPLVLVMLHKRIPLAFMIRDKIPKEKFDGLREGSIKAFGLDQYSKIFIEPRLAQAARNSLVLGVITGILATALAFAISYGINRGGMPLPNLVRYGTLTPLVSPPIIVAFATILLFGREGLVTRTLLEETLGWINADQTNLYGWGGVIIAQTLSFLPAAFIVLDDVMAKQEGRLEDAAAILGAGAGQTFRRVTLPMAQPALIKAFIVVFVMSMTDFANPLTIGRGMPILAGILYDEMIGFHNTRLSAALAVWLITPAVAFSLLSGRIGRRKRYSTDGRNAGRSELPIPAAARIGLIAVTYSVLALIAVVYATVVVGSFVRMWGVDYSFTLGWYFPEYANTAGFASGYRGLESVWFSLKIAAIAAPIGGLLAAVIAFLAERTWLPGRNLIALTTLLPAAIPGVIFGIGYIIAFNLPFGIRSLSLTGTVTIIILNILFANLFVGVLAGRATLQRLDISIDEAAEILGASIGQRFFRVILPMMWHAALLGALYIFVHGMTTLSAVIFLISPGTRLASYAIFDSALNAYYGSACAMSVAILVIVFATMGAMWLLERRGPMWMRLGAEASGRI